MIVKDYIYQIVTGFFGISNKIEFHFRISEQFQLINKQIQLINNKFTLHVNGFNGTLDNALTLNNKQKKSTFDPDNDSDSTRHCAFEYFLLFQKCRFCCSKMYKPDDIFNSANAVDKFLQICHQNTRGLPHLEIFQILPA